MGQTEIRTSMHIAAPPGDVWAILADFPGYRRWNPMVTSVDGTASEGGKATLHYRSSVGLALSFDVRVTRLEPDRELRWIGVRMGITGEHYFQLAPEGDGTRLVHGEIFRGFGAGALGFVFRAQVPVFERFNRAIGAEAERLAGGVSRSGTEPSRR